MSEEIPMLSIIKKGSKRYPRYVVTKADAYKNPLFWNGTTWTTNEADAVLFENVTQALWVYHDALTESVSDRPCHRFVVPLYVEVYGEKPSLDDLRGWLNRSMRIVVDSPKHGLGPKGTVGVIIADVDETRSV
jgi:hypothetical protein